MHSLEEFFHGLFRTDLWPPRWHCGTWSDFLGWLYIVSDILIWAAYFLIPVIILNYFSKKKHHLKFQSGYMLFALFILLCGSTHFIDALMFWIPMYRLNALVRFLTGVVSLATVYYLVKILPSAFSQKTNTELEKEIAHRQQVELKLATVNQKLIMANKDLEAFAYIASHDLKEPVRKILTFHEILQENSSLDDQAKKYVGKIASAANRMYNLVSEILALSTLPEEVKLQACDPLEAVNQALKDVEVKTSETNACIEVKPLPNVIANSSYLSQVFTNLLNNALKFSTAKPKIEIYGKQINDRVLLYIQDNGIGMKPEFIEKIFTPFFRLHSRAEYEGSGIGLAICKKIIVLHNGYISVESTPGKGTTFLIDLPAAN